MAYSLENTTDLTALANAIRAKTGDNATMTVSAMATAVAGISGGGSSWTPTTFITSEMEFSKYSAELDLTNYLGNSPFLLCVVYIKNNSMSGVDYGWCVFYYNGSNINRIAGIDTSDLQSAGNSFSCDYYNGIISFSNTNTPWDEDTMAFLIS